MANSRSALKRVRKTATQTTRNRVIKSRVKTFRKKVLTAIEEGDQKEAQAALGQFSSITDKAARSNILHRKAAARSKARLFKQVSAMK